MPDARSEDRFLGGRVIAHQMLGGFRSGLDAVMLAAAIPATRGQTILELGSGAGVAALCVAARLPDCTVTGLERDPGLAGLANENAAANAMADRVRFVEGDVFALPSELRREFDHVLCNPPFHDEEGRASPDEARAAALHDAGRLADWLKAGLKRSASGGTLTAILRTDRLGEALAALPHRGTLVLPLWPKAGLEAKRVIVQVTKGARRPLGFLPGLVLHDAAGGYTSQADAVLRDGAALDFTPRRKSEAAT